VPRFESAYEEREEPGKDDGTDCSGVRVPDRNGFNKRIALTFDDGPNPRPYRG
jgi:peptidoglycan/xylan/chitin deacetylase (PgdA/CDA1 family)